MPKLPVLKPQEVVSRPEALGFVEVRQRGASQAVPSSGRPRNDGAVPHGARHLPGIAAKDCPRHWNVRREPCRCECIAAEPAAAPDRDKWCRG